MKARSRGGISVLALMFVSALGCTTTHRDARVNSLETPIKIQFAKAGSPRASFLLMSGQIIEPPQCCPPLELRNASGAVVRKFEVTAGPQRLVAPRGTYSLVGHDPSGEECVVQIQVVGD